MNFCDNPECEHHIYVPKGTEEILHTEVLNPGDIWGLTDETLVRRHEFRVNYSFPNVYPTPPSTYGESTWLCDTCAGPVKFLQDRTDDFKRRMILSDNPKPTT